MQRKHAVRLWIFNHHAATPDQGTGTRHFDLAKQLNGHGVETTIFAAGFNHATGREERLRRWQLFRTQYLDGVRFVWLKTVPYQRNDFRRFLSMLSYFFVSIVVQSRFATPTHVIGSTVHPIAGLAALFVARIRAIPFYFEIRDLWPQSLIDIRAISEQSIAAYILRAVEKLLVHQAAAVISLLPGIRDYMNEYGLRPRRLVHVPNGILLSDDEASAPSEHQRLLRQRRATGKFVVIYTGAHGIANRLSVVLDAAAELRRRKCDHVHLVLVGDGPEKPSLLAKAASLQLDNVEMWPPVAKKEVGALLKAADACLLHVTSTPVYRYGMSFNKLFDYLRSERPVVFACDSSYDPVSISRAGVTIPPENHLAMADALEHLAQLSEATRAQMGRRGRSYVAKHHNIAVLARQLRSLLHEA